MNDWQKFIFDKLPILLQKLFEQVYLTLGAVFIAMLLSIPIGIIIARRNKIKNYVLGISSILQTLPSLAVLGFLLPFLGIGIKTAIVTLVLYAMLPILRNTVTGLLGISPELLEAADGLGFTKMQKMLRVELPLALPVIVAGIRTATAMSVGIATIAAFIGAGGLGDFIYEGLSLNNMSLILLGAVPAALLALLLDYVIARIENVLSAKHRNKISAKNPKLWLVVIFFLLLPVFFFYVQAPSSNRVTIGTKNFTEQLILGELLAQLLQANTTLQVCKKFNLGGTFICHHALVSGDIDMYPEYTGTAYNVILQQNLLKNPSQVYEYVKKVYQQNFQVAWLDVFGFNNSNAVAVRRKFAKEFSLKTISDLKPIAKRLTIGVPADFMQRPDGFLGLKKQYQLEFKSVRLMDPGLLYKAIHLGQIDLIMAFSTDGRIPAYDLLILQDNKHLFPTYLAAPIVREATLKKHPELKVILNKLAGKINNQVMQNLNYQVDVLKNTPEEVADNFLKRIGLK